MAIIAMDGFDVSSANSQTYINQNFSNAVYVDNTNLGSPAAPTGIFSDFGLGTVFYYFYTFAPTKPSSLIVAMHWRMANNTHRAEDILVVELDDGTIPLRLRCQNHSFLYLLDKNSNTLASTTTPGVVKKDEYNWLSIKIVIHASSGLFEVKDAYGDVILSYSGDTVQGATTTSMRRIFLGNNSTFTTTYDNVVIATTSGGTVSDHITEHRIITLRPNANGDTVTGWTANGAAALWDCLDETGIDNGTTNISATTDGATFLMNFQDLTTAETGYKAVALTHWCVREDAGLWYITPRIKTGGTVYSGTEMKMPNANTSAYGPFTQIWEVNPNTSAVWTPSEINALQGGLSIRLAT
jgi:hypothetical protein